MSKIPAINEIDANSPSQESTEVVVKATTVTPDINEIQETISASATIQEIDGTRKPTISEIYKIVNDGLFESTTNWWDYAYKISQAQLNQDIISRLDNGVIGGGYSKGVDIITTTSNKVPSNTNVYSALKSDSLYPKKLNDEVINGIYDFLNGLTIGKPTAYTGGTWSVDQTGRTHLTTDYIYVRLKAIFETLQILNVDTIGGKLVISPAGSIRVAYVDKIKIDAPVFTHNEETDVWSISQVEDAEGNLVNETLNQEVYRCYFLGEQDGEEIDNKWKVGDQAQAKTFNVKKGTYHKVENSYLWRLVVNVSSNTVDIDGKKYHYVDLSQIDFDSGSDAPAPGDILNQLGHRLNDTQRQTALVLNAVDNYAPSITLYAEVNYYTLLNKEYVEFGVYNGKAFFNVYGDMYIGDKGDNPKTYIKYKNGKINIKANLEIGSSIGDKDLDQYIKDNGGVDEETVINLINNSQVIKDLQNQADGAIETWFYEGVPTLDNLPAVDWNTNELKKIHIGDLYYDQTTGYAYRFTKYNDDVNPYRWNRIKDNDIVAALEAANHAQATADDKMKVFYGETKPTNYKVGDMWVNATLEGKFNNDIVRAVADNETFNANDWVLASRYSEAIATIQKWTNEYETKFGIIEGQLDGKAETWYQVDDPSKSWTDKASHEGDIWYNINNSTTNYWNGSAWKQMDIPKDIFDTIDGKSSIFVDSYADAKAGTGIICKGYKERDLWILPEDATINGVKYYKGDILTAVSNNTNFNETNWEKKVRYVGPTELTNAIDIVNDKINTINNTTIPGINNKFNEFIKDGVLDSSEKARLTDLLNQASNEVAAIVDQVNNITTSKYLTNDNANKGKLEEANTVMNTAWTEYKNLINTLVNANTEITKVNIGEANTKYKNLQEKIKAVKQYLAICQADILSGMGTDISSYKYLKEAFKGKTEVNGGLVVTNVLQLRQTSDASSPVTAGISGLQGKANADGIVDKNTYDITSIAAWFGGPMVDKDIFTDEQLNNKVAGTDYARSLFRHDGSGYLASGAIYWGTDGILHGNPNSFILQGTSIATIFYYTRLFYLHYANQDSTDFNNIDYITPKKTFSRLNILSLGGVEDSNNLPTGLFIGDSKTGGSFQIGNVILRTKSGDPNILEIVSADSNKTAHLGVQGGVSAYGTYTPSTGDGGGLNGTIVPYATAITSDPQNEGSKIASASSIYKLHSRISNIENNGATSITVTGTGNAITSVSKNGTSITFTKGTTFLTSHQSLANYVTINDSRLSDSRYPKFANNTWYLVGDDVYIGDHNIPGIFCIKSANNNSEVGINFCSKDETDNASIWYNNNVKRIYIDKEVAVRNHRLWIQGEGPVGGNNNRLTLVAGMPSGLAYNTSSRGTILYSNGIAFADPYNGNSNNDSGWIRHLETTPNHGTLEIAVGDDTSDEEIHFRWYNSNTSAETIVNDITVPRATGTLALTSQIPTSLPANGGNADTVDGIHANGLLTALSNSNNGISITVGGTTKSISNISVNYASSSGSTGKLTSLGDYTYDNLSTDILTNAVSYKIITSGGTDLGDSQYNVLHIPWSSGDWGIYLLFGANNGRFGVKYKHSGIVREVLDSSNYASYAIPNSASCNKNWSYSGQSGQPSWLWGSNDGTNCYVWNPSNFSVAKSEYSRCLLGRNTSGSDYDTNKANLVFAEWNTMNDSRWYLKATGYECRVAFASSAGSSKKLETARNIFGLPFDGTNDIGSKSFLVDSYIDTDTSAIKWTAKITSKYTSASTGGQGLLIGAATDRKYCRGGGIAAYATNVWGNNTNLAIYKSQGNDYDVKPVEVITITEDLNVGIGTNSPTYKLHVEGTIYSSSTIRTAAQNQAIVLSNDASPAWISALEGQVIFNTGKPIRFGETSWDWNQWAGLKYTHSNKTIYLGIADGSVFNANSAQTGGMVNLVNCSLKVDNTVCVPYNTIGISFRSTYYWGSWLSHQTAGNEALVIASNDYNTAIMFVNGESYTNISSSRFQSMTPALTIEHNQVMINRPYSSNGCGYNFYVNGTSNFNGDTTINNNLSVNGLISNKGILPANYEFNNKGTSCYVSADALCSGITAITDSIQVNQVTVQYSNDNGNSWINYPMSNDVKFNLYASNAGLTKVYLGYNVITGNNDAEKLAQIKKNQLMFTFDVPDNCYSQVYFASVDISNGINTICTVDILNNSGAVVETYTKHMTGWNQINYISLLHDGNAGYGVGNNDRRYIRFKFKHDQKTTALRNTIINKIRIFAFTKHSFPTDRFMGHTGHIYNFDYNMNTYFPNSILAKGGVTAYQSSDVRLKTNITKLNCLKVIKSIGGTYEFDYIRDHKHSIGFIAQNVNNPLLKDIVAKDDNGYLKINYWNPKLISLAFGALTEIDDEVDKLKARVRELESEVEYLKNKDYVLQ